VTRIALTVAAAVATLAAPVAAGPSSPPWQRLHRPLHLPSWKPGLTCPRTPGRPANSFSPYGNAYALGRGPVYPLVAVNGFDPNVAGGAIPFVRNVSAWDGTGFKVLWISSPAYNGPILVRGARLDKQPLLRFSGFGKELRLRAARGWNEGWRDYPSETYVRLPGCYGYQLDGLTFSRVIVFRVAR
jgi:hypothetical protein